MVYCHYTFYRLNITNLYNDAVYLFNYWIAETCSSVFVFQKLVQFIGYKLIL